MKHIFLTLLAFVTISLNAQDMALTYEEAVKIALEQNVALRTQQNQMMIVKAEKDQSRGEMAPTVSAGLRGFQSNGNTQVQEPDGQVRFENRISNNISGSLNANINLFSGFSQMNKLKLANAYYEAQLHLISRSSQDVIFTVTIQYLQVLLDTEFLEIAGDNLKTQELLYRQINAMVEGGSKPKSDLYDQLATVKNMELLVLQAKNNLSNDKSNLSITLQLDPTVDIKVNSPDWDLDEIRFYEVNLDDLYDLSINNRPDLKQYQYNEVAAKKQTSIAKSYFAPTLFGYYNLNSWYNDKQVGIFNEQFTNHHKSMQYGMSLNIPIFSGLRNKTTYVRQKVLFENSKINTENLRKTILNDVRNAYQNFEDVRTAYEVSIAQFEASDMALKVQKEKYELGVGSLIELTNSNNNYVLAASRQAQARLNLLFQKVILDYHTGVLQSP